MQQFHALLLLADVVLKLHTAVAVSLIGNFEPSTARQLGFDLSRTGGAGLWGDSLRLASERLQRYLPAVHATADAEWFGTLHLWLLRKRKRADADELGALLLDLRTFRAQLAGESTIAAPSAQGTALDLMELLVEVRNKTTAHAAYGADFYEAHLSAIDSPTSWLIDHSPLWRAGLAVTLRRRGDTVARTLRGTDPTNVRQLNDRLAPEVPICLLPGGELQELVPLLHVDVADSQVYMANGNWRDSDSSAEFLCHSLEAQRPEQGKRRIELPEYAIRPAAAPASDTEELGAFKHDAGVALNNLPLPTATYIRRPSLETRLGPLIADPQRRHLITVRGHGGIGKTSLILAICRELAERGPECPYDAIIWLSARDVDLTVRGPKQVRRATGTIADVWERIAELFDAGALDPMGQKEFFEERLRDDKLLLILDNFETFDDRRAAYDYFDSVTYPPSKVVITSRHDFEGDTTVSVDQMSWSEASQLLVVTARQVGAEPLMTETVQAAIYDRCRGHPYAMKLAAAHLRSRAGVAAELPRVLRDEQLLEALFRSSIDDLGGDDEPIFVFLLVGQFPTGLSEPALRIVSAERDVDLDSAVKALGLRSLLEMRAEDAPWPVYNMPAMAREFARKLIVGHTLNTEVTIAADFLRRFPGIEYGAVAESAAAMLRDVRGGRISKTEIDQTLGALRTLALLEPALWLSFARAERHAGMPQAQWEDSYKRAVEESPDPAEILWEWSEVVAGADRQIELKVQAVAADPSNIAVASRAALLLNGLYATQRGLFPPLIWRALLRQVAEALEEHFDELDAPALSRLAWLHIHAGDQGRGDRAASRGATVDPDNRDIQKLLARRVPPRRRT